MVDATFMLNLVETVGILVGVTIAIMELRKGREERRNQFSAELLRTWSTREFWENWISFLRNMDFSTIEEWNEKYGPYVNPEASKHWYSLIFFYDLLGKRVIDGQIDLESVLFYVEPFGILLTWEKSLPIFEEWRERMKFPIMSGFEFLVNSVQERYPTLMSTPYPDRERLMQR